MELKPCPFCGGKARIVSVSERYTVGCTIMRCRGNWLTARDYYTKDEAAEAWNTRAERTCQEVEVTSRYQPYVTYMTACSLCGGTLAVDEYSAPNYCPSCGARVVEEVDADGQG